MLNINENIRIRSIRKRRRKVKNILYFLIANSLLLCNFAIWYVSSSEEVRQIHDTPLSDKAVTVQYLPGESLPDELTLASNEVITEDLAVEE